MILFRNCNNFLSEFGGYVFYIHLYGFRFVLLLFAITASNKVFFSLLLSNFFPCIVYGLVYLSAGIFALLGTGYSNAAANLVIMLLHIFITTYGCGIISTW